MEQYQWNIEGGHCSMYKAYLDGQTLYVPNNDMASIIDPVVQLNLDEAGSFSFSIPPSNPLYNKIYNRKSMVQVVNGKKEVFYGEVRESKKNIYGVKEIYVTGEFSFLYDSIQPQRYIILSAQEFLSALLASHNSQVEERKYFYAGIVVKGNIDIDKIQVKTDRETTADIIKEQLVEALGLHIRIRKENGKRYIDLVPLSSFGKQCSQAIRFGENLLDYTETMTSDDVITALIPLGATIETDDEELETRWDITSVNDGKEYLYNQNAVNEFGWVRAVNTWDDISDPAILKKAGEEYLKSGQFQDLILEVKAVDLSMISMDYDELNVGDYVRAIAKPFGMDKWFPIQSKEIHLADPASNTFILSDTSKSKYFTDWNNQQNNDLKNDINNTHTIISKIRIKFEQTAEGIIGTVENLASDVESEFKQVADEIALRVTQGEMESAIKVAIDGIHLTASQISLEGYTSINGGFIVLPNGDLYINSGKINIHGQSTDSMITLESDMYDNTMTPQSFALHNTDNDATVIAANFFNQYTQAGKSVYMSNGMITADRLVLKTMGTINGSNIATLVDIPQVTSMLTATIDGGRIVFANSGAVGWQYAHRTFQTISSDFRLKKDFHKIFTNDISEIYLNMKPYEYRYKSNIADEKIHSGILAQQLIKLFEERGIDWKKYALVQEIEPLEFTNEGEYIGKSGYGIDYNNLHAWHILMIQKQQTEIEALRAENSSLKTRLQKIEKIVLKEEGE